MNRNCLNRLLLTILIIFIFFPISSSQKSTLKNDCWLEEIDGVRVLHLNGDYYNIGYYHGLLLKDEIQINMRILFDFFNEMGFSYEDLVEYWYIYKINLPEKFILELNGLADGCNLSLDEIGVYNILHDIANLITCSGALVWNSATLDGDIIHMRSTDHDIFNRDPDPITGISLQENQVLIIRNPIDNYASMSPMWAGRIGSWGGINEKGIGVSENTCWTNDTSTDGICANFRMGMVLDSAETSVEAIAILDNNKTVGWNLLISDGNKAEGYILEQTANISYLCTWNDPIENLEPFWQIEDTLRRTNCFISPECSFLQRDHYDPSDFSSLFNYLIGRSPYFGIYRHYISLSKGIEKYWGSLDLNNSMKLLRACYNGEYDLFFYLMQKFNSFSPMHQWVANPKTGDFLICFADDSNIASVNPIHHFNLFELLDK